MEVSSDFVEEAAFDRLGRGAQDLPAHVKDSGHFLVEGTGLAGADEGSFGCVLENLGSPVWLE